MAENSVSATPSNSDISSSRLTNRQSEKKAEGQARIIALQEKDQKVRDQKIAETQTGRKINIHA